MPLLPLPFSFFFPLPSSYSRRMPATCATAKPTASPSSFFPPFPFRMNPGNVTSSFLPSPFLLPTFFCSSRFDSFHFPSFPLFFLFASRQSAWPSSPFPFSPSSHPAMNWTQRPHEILSSSSPHRPASPRLPGYALPPSFFLFFLSLRLLWTQVHGHEKIMPPPFFFFSLSRQGKAYDFSALPSSSLPSSIRRWESSGYASYSSRTPFPLLLPLQVN